MKKVNPSYLAIWFGVPLAAAIILMVLSFTAFKGDANTASIIFTVSVFVIIGVLVGVPMIMESKMKKSATAMEAGFKDKGFTYQYKFEASNAVYYIDQGGRMGAVYRFNPTELQFVDLSKVTNVRTNSGQFGAGTSRVCCEFQLDGKKVRINTLTVSRGSLSMKDKRVQEAISKADQLGVMLNTAKANAKA